VSVLGASGAGKTVYLGFLLDLLSKGTPRLKGVANSTFSLAVQDETLTSLQNRRFPEKTPSEADNWQWVHCEVHRLQKPKNYADIITPDFAGEAIALEVERPGSYPAIRYVVAQSRGLLILCDSLRVRDASLSEDMFATKLACYIHSLQQSLSNRQKTPMIDLPVAIVFTKTDWCPEARFEPDIFARNNLPRMVQICARNFARHRFFAASVVGRSATLRDRQGRSMQLALHVEAHGIAEPLEWILRYC
jgi:hypothetical protein